MAKKKVKLSSQEMDFIGQREAFLQGLIGAIQEVAKFKTGDFLIAFKPSYSYGMRTEKRTQIVNSYGAPKKYTVVYTDKFGVPYMKELNKNGNPIGQLISSLRFEDGQRAVKQSNIEFEIDPDYTDAIIMDDEQNYDASAIARAKSETFKEITKHNKSLKIKLKNGPELLKFVKTLKVGDVFWKSIKTNFTIISLNPIPTTHNGTRIKEYEVIGRARDSKGKEWDIDHTTFYWHAIYTAQPRSYNELKDPK